MLFYAAMATPVLLLALALVLAIRSHGLARLWWAGCAATTAGGILLMAATLFYPPEEFDAAGNLIGEMPKAFAVALWLVTFGCATTLAGVIGLALRRLMRR